MALSVPKSQPALNSKIEAVIFDLDGVLMDSETIAFGVWQEIAARHGGLLTEHAFQETVGLSAEETAELVMNRAGVSFERTEAITLAWEMVTERLKKQAAPLPGAAELVRELAQRKISLAVASNSLSSYISTALTSLSLNPYFQVRVGIDQVPRGKPAPDIYLEAARRLGIDPVRCLAIEDSRVGVRAAFSAGMHVVAVPSPHDNHAGYDGAWKILGSMAEVMNQIQPYLCGQGQC